MRELIIIIILSLLLLFTSYKWLRFRIRALRNFKKMREFYNAINEEEIVHIHTDKFGQKWYTWKNVLNLPPERGIMAELATNQLDMNITRDSLQKFVVRMLNNCNSGQFTKVVSDLETIADRLTWVAEEKTLEELALVYLIIEGENLRTPSQKDTQRKRKVFAEDEESRSFFLRLAWKNTKLYSDISDSDILPYLALKKVNQKRKDSTILNQG